MSDSQFKLFNVCLQTNLEFTGYRELTDKGKRNEKLVKQIALLGTENDQSQENLSMQKEQQKKDQQQYFKKPQTEMVVKKHFTKVIQILLYESHKSRASGRICPKLYLLVICFCLA